MAYHLVYLPENMTQPAVRAFRAWLLEAVGRDGKAPASWRSS
jgi:DNA-binding transcriptional LysR family regulator